MRITLHLVFLVVAVALFAYAAFLIDHGKDLPGNAVVLTNAGLAVGFASFIPAISKR